MKRKAGLWVLGCLLAISFSSIGWANINSIEKNNATEPANESRQTSSESVTAATDSHQASQSKFALNEADSTPEKTAESSSGEPLQAAPIPNKRPESTTQTAQTGAHETASQTALGSGASSLTENYADWQIACAVNSDKQNACVLSQRQQKKETGQQVLLMVLQVDKQSVKGNLVLPFGLLLSDGVSLQIDDEPFLAKADFRTCIPSGCVVPLTFSDKQLNQLVQGQQLNLHLVISDNNEPVKLAVSLNGLAKAIARVNNLQSHAE